MWRAVQLLPDASPDRQCSQDVQLTADGRIRQARSTRNIPHPSSSVAAPGFLCSHGLLSKWKRNTKWSADLSMTSNMNASAYDLFVFIVVREWPRPCSLDELHTGHTAWNSRTTHTPS